MKDSIVVGLMLGDEGKGTIVDYLATENRPEAVVRFSGGSQAAHNVVTEKGWHHTFTQFGAASLRGVPTTLSRYMIVNPFALVIEGDKLYEFTGWNPFPDLKISAEALITTPIHIWLNQKREEARGNNAHGSCGMGIGETRYFDIQHPSHSMKMGDLKNANRSTLTEKLTHLIRFAEAEVGQTYNSDASEPLTVDTLVDMYMMLSTDGFLNILKDEHILGSIADGYHIFEGSQGILLDESYGFHPHTTWSSVTPNHAQQLLREAGKPAGEVYGVTRTYLTRHGYGPFPSELTRRKSQILFPEQHNGFGKYQGNWRAGWFDAVLFDYATRVAKAQGGLDHIAVTHADMFERNGNLGYVPLSGYKNLQNNAPDGQWLPTDLYNRDRTLQEAVTQTMMGMGDSDYRLASLSSLEGFTELIRFVTGQIPSLLSFGPVTTNKKRVH